jgi:hypothetical protein
MIRSFLTELKKRNEPLYWFGWYNLILGLVCIILMPIDSQQVLGINRWIKPMKFFLSVWIMIWSMGWLLFYLANKRKVTIISWLFISTMFIENFLITMQSVRGVASHFNVTDAFNGMVFSVMGIAIIVFTCAAIYAAWLFFKQKNFTISPAYLWGIRLGILFFIIFSLEAGFMLSRLSHTVGGPDGGPGLPLLNWSTEHGDLRIAHFLGIHSLQILPLAGYYLFRKKTTLILFSVVYFLLLIMVLVMALNGLPAGIFS